MLPIQKLVKPQALKLITNMYGDPKTWLIKQTAQEQTRTKTTLPTHPRLEFLKKLLAEAQNQRLNELFEACPTNNTNITLTVTRTDEQQIPDHRTLTWSLHQGQKPIAENVVVVENLNDPKAKIECLATDPEVCKFLLPFSNEVLKPLLGRYKPNLELVSDF